MQHGNFSRRKALAVGLAGIGVLSRSWAAEYPNKPVRVIVPYPAGGATDVVARTTLQKLGEQMNQSFIIDNRGGANGIIGTEQVAHAAPDGYTLLFNTAGAQTLNPVIYQAKYEALGSFEPIGMICEIGMLLIARKDLPANNVQELIALAKKSGKPLSASTGSAMLMVMTEQFKRVIGAPNIIVAQYKGTSPQMQAVVSGEVDFAIDAFVSVEMIKAGKVKLLGALMPQRAESFPQTPTLQEQGVHGMEFSSWAGMLAPKGTPRAIVDTLATALEKAAQSPDVVARMKTYDYVPNRLMRDQFGKRIQSDYERWKRVVKETNFKLE